MTQSIEKHLPDLLRLARSLTPYPVTLRKEVYDGEELNVFGIEGIPKEAVAAETLRITDAITMVCWDADIELAFVVFDEKRVGTPDPGSRRRPPPAQAS